MLQSMRDYFSDRYAMERSIFDLRIFTVFNLAGALVAIFFILCAGYRMCRVGCFFFGSLLSLRVDDLTILLVSCIDFCSVLRKLWPLWFKNLFANILRFSNSRLFTKFEISILIIELRSTLLLIISLLLGKYLDLKWWLVFLHLLLAMGRIKL